MCQQLIAYYNKILLITFLIIQSILIKLTTGQLLTIKEHRTPGATQRVNDLWCYQCDTMDDGERCIDLAGNHSSLMKKCENEKRICMVKQFSHSITTENSTSQIRMWSLERNCTKHCEPGCIVIGERTKLYACTSCCEQSLCNTGRGHATITINTSLIGYWSIFVTSIGPTLQYVYFSLIVN